MFIRIQLARLNVSVIIYNMQMKRKFHIGIISKGNLACAVCIFILLLIGIQTASKLYDNAVFVRCPCFIINTSDTAVQNSLKLQMKLKNNNKTLIDQIEMEHQSFPAEFLIRQELEEHRCYSNPTFFAIRHQNRVWQEVQILSTKYLLFSAHLDRRDSQKGTLIRILALAESASPPTPYCLAFNSENISPVASKAISQEFIHWQYPLDKTWHPFIVTCRGTDEYGNTVKVVSLAENSCSTQLTNALRVIEHISTVKKDLAICTKFLYGQADISIRLTEWIETLLSLGVQNITFYIHSVHPNVAKVLAYYETIGIVSQFLWRNPSPFPNSPSVQKIFFDTQRYSLFTLENIPYTDCLLRHINSHHFVGVWDTDEMFIPQTGSSIVSVIRNARDKWKTMNKQPATSYASRVSYFFTNLTDYSTINQLTNKTDGGEVWTESLQILTHSKRSVKFTPLLSLTKAIHDTSLALGIHAHYALSNIYGKINRQTDIFNLYPTSESFIGHYRDKCQGLKQEKCDLDFKRNIVEDRTLLRSAETILHNLSKVLNKLQIL